jgi:hypothetical protein
MRVEGRACIRELAPMGEGAAAQYRRRCGAMRGDRGTALLVVRSGEGIRCREAIGAIRMSTEKQQTAPLASPPAVAEVAHRKKGIYIGAPACFALELAARHLAEAFGCYGGAHISGLYVVGSALVRADWRDVDVVLMLDDPEFIRLFPHTGKSGEHHEHDALWLLLTVALSRWLSEQTGLTVDFKIQPRGWANERHRGNRNAIGLRLRKETND